LQPIVQWIVQRKTQWDKPKFTA